MTVASGGAGGCAARAVPRALVDAAGRVRVAAWLDEIADTDAGRALRAIVAAHPGAAALMAAIASSSPYSVGSRPRRSRPARHPAAIGSRRAARRLPGAGRARCARCTSRAQTQADAMRILREMKAEAALLIALADIGGLWEVMRVTRALTERRGYRDRRRRAPSAAPAPPDPACWRRPIPIAPRSAPATSCSPWARWVPASSIIPATSTSWCSSIRPRPRSLPGVEPSALFVRLTRQPRQDAAGADRRRATCSASTCDCARTRPRPRSRSRFRRRSTITRAGARTGSAPR